MVHGTWTWTWTWTWPLRKLLSAYPRQGDVRPFFPDGKDTERGENSTLFPSFPPRSAALGTVLALSHPALSPSCFGC